MSAVKNAVIAVAGMGKRLGMGHPKCLVKVNNKTLLEYQLSLLERIENVFLVVGFGEQDIIEFAPKVRKDLIFVRNVNFRNTKTLGSFYCAAKIIKGNAIFMDGDMIIEPKSFEQFLETAESNGDDLTIAVSKRISDDPVYTEVVEGADGRLTVIDFSYEKKTKYEWANVVCLSTSLMADGNTHTFEYLKKISPPARMWASVIDRLEIDTLTDLRNAEDFIDHNNWF